MSRGYVLTEIAREDLQDIRDYYIREGGNRVAHYMLEEFRSAFRFLARTPGAGHRREDLAENRPILFWSMRDFMILYRNASGPIEILGVLRGSRDLPSIIRMRRL